MAAPRPLEWHPCWLCGGTCNPQAPSGHSYSATIERTGMPALVRHVHAVCHGVHSGVKRSGRLDLASIVPILPEIIKEHG